MSLPNSVADGLDFISLAACMASNVRLLAHDTRSAVRARPKETSKCKSYMRMWGFFACGTVLHKSHWVGIEKTQG